MKNRNPIAGIALPLFALWLFNKAATPTPAEQAQEQAQEETQFAAMGMLKSKFLPPYQDDNRTTFYNTKKQAGVYIIKENGIITYIGHSQSNLYKTLYRHFQIWNDRTQYRVTYNNRSNYTVRVILTTPAQAVRLERYLINKYQPRDNKEKIDLFSKTDGVKDHEKYEQAEDFEPAPF